MKQVNLDPTKHYNSIYDLPMEFKRDIYNDIIGPIKEIKAGKFTFEYDEYGHLAADEEGNVSPLMFKSTELPVAYMTDGKVMITFTYIGEDVLQMNFPIDEVEKLLEEQNG